MEILIEVFIFLLLALTVPCLVGYLIAVFTGSDILGVLIFVVLVVGMFYDPDTKTSNKGEKDD